MRINPKWILAAMIVAFAISLYKKQTTPDMATPDLATAPSGSDDSWTPPLSRGNDNAPSSPQWPPVVESSTAAAMSTVNYYVVFDGSGSMQSKRCGGGTSKIKAATAAVKHFFTTVPADANVGLTAFDRFAISERVPLGVGNRDALFAALGNVQAGSGTPLRTSIKIGYEKLTAQASQQLGYGEYHLVVVTDGEADPGSEDPTPIVTEILAQSPVVLHTIGFCIDADHVLNQPNRTYYASATSPEQLQSSLQAVLAEAPSFDATHFN